MGRPLYSTQVADDNASDQENQQPLPIPPPLARRLSSPPPEYTSRSPSPASSTLDLSTVGVEDSHLVDHSRHPDVNQLLRALLTNPTPVVNATERGLQYFLREYRCLYNEQRELDALEGNLVDAADIAEDALDALHEAFGEGEEQRQISDYDIAERQARALENVGHHAHELRRLARHSLNTTRRLSRTTRTWRNFLIQTFELPAFRARMAPLASVINDAAPPPGELPAAARRVPGEARRQGTYLPLFHTRVSAGSRRPRDPSPDERNVRARRDISPAPMDASPARPESPPSLHPIGRSCLVCGSPDHEYLRCRDWRCVWCRATAPGHHPWECPLRPEDMDERFTS